jgi:hypothetical protein
VARTARGKPCPTIVTDMSPYAERSTLLGVKRLA